MTFEILGAAKLVSGFENPREGSCGEAGRNDCTFCSCRDSEDGEVGLLFKDGVRTT